MILILPVVLTLRKLGLVTLCTTPEHLKVMVSGSGLAEDSQSVSRSHDSPREVEH